MPASPRITLESLRQLKLAGKKIPMLTCYDFPTARILADAGLPSLLVGDSAAMTMLGEESTVHVTFDFLLTITRAVRRGAPDVFLLADMPFASYPDPTTAVNNAARFIRDAGADAVKLEADSRHENTVRALSAAGIATCAHLGLLPQGAIQEGGYHAHGRTPADAQRIIDDAVLLVSAGAQMVLLEAVPNEVSAEIVRRLGADAARPPVPVIGCGGGSACDGHVVVLHDMLGYTDRVPRFVDKIADVPAAVGQAARQYVEDIQAQRYPAPRHQYAMKTPAQVSLKPA